MTIIWPRTPIFRHLKCQYLAPSFLVFCLSHLSGGRDNYKKMICVQGKQTVSDLMLAINTSPLFVYTNHDMDVSVFVWAS